MTSRLPVFYHGPRSCCGSFNSRPNNIFFFFASLAANCEGLSLLDSNVPSASCLCKLMSHAFWLCAVRIATQWVSSKKKKKKKNAARYIVFNPAGLCCNRNESHL